jgi:hypothetical protein
MLVEIDNRMTVFSCRQVRNVDRKAKMASVSATHSVPKGMEKEEGKSIFLPTYCAYGTETAFSSEHDWATPCAIDTGLSALNLTTLASPLRRTKSKAPALRLFFCKAGALSLT